MPAARERSRAFALSLALAGALASPAVAFADASPAPATPVPTTATPAPYGTNLVINGDAEAEPGSTSASTVVKPSSWATTGEFTSIQYGTGGGFPDATSPGPKARGKSLFEGGNKPLSTATQSIALGGYVDDIDKGVVKYRLSAWIGGYGSQEDHAVVAVDFKGASGAELQGSAIGPVSAAARKSITGSLEKSADGNVPKGARSAVITITIKREEGTYNDGSVDNVDLTLSKT